MLKFLVNRFLLIFFIPFIIGAASVDIPNSDSWLRDDALSSSFNMTAGSSDFSVGMWARQDSFTDTKSCFFAHTEDNSTFSDGWGVSLTTGGTAIQLFTVGANSGDQSITVTTGKWHFYYFEFLQSSTTISIYQDGSLIYQDTSYANTSAITTPEIVIGVEQDNPTPADTNMDGAVAYIQFFNRGLNEAERENIRWCPGSITNGLIEHWLLINNFNAFLNPTNNLTNTGTSLISDGPPISFCGGSK